MEDDDDLTIDGSVLLELLTPQQHWRPPTSTGVATALAPDRATTSIGTKVTLAVLALAGLVIVTIGVFVVRPAGVEPPVGLNEVSVNEQ